MEGQHGRDLRWILELHHHSAIGLYHTEESSASSKIAKMKEAFLKQHPMKPPIYLAIANLLKFISLDLLTGPESPEGK